jgi:hypothetical protein
VWVNRRWREQQNARNNIQSITIIVMDTKDIIQSLSVLSTNYHAAQNELSNKYRFDQLRDVRINVFKHCFIVIDSTYIILLVRLHHLYDNTWWSSLMERNLIGKQLTKEQRSIFIHGFDTFVDSAYITMLFVSVESAFRSFYSSTFSKKTPFREIGIMVSSLVGKEDTIR